VKLLARLVWARPVADFSFKDYLHTGFSQWQLPFYSYH